MRLYRRHIASGGYDNAADYPNGEPFPAGAGFEWVQGVPPVGAAPLVDLKTRLFEAFQASVAEHSGTLTPAQRAGIYQLQAASDKAFEFGDVPAVAALIEAASLPPSLETERQNLLNLLNGG